MPRHNRQLKPHQWKPGESGQPNGAPKGYPEVRRLLLAERHGEATDVLSKLYRMAMKGNVFAAKIFLERVWGPPREDVGGHEGGNMRISIGWTKENFPGFTIVGDPPADAIDTTLVPQLPAATVNDPEDR